MLKTVKQISELTGISIRALRYYDEIGLLVPSDKTEAGYRLYDEKAIEKLGAILFLRELDIPLKEIKEAVNRSDFNCSELLKKYRTRVEQKQKRLNYLMEMLNSMETSEQPVSFAPFEAGDVDKLSSYIIEDIHKQEPLCPTIEQEKASTEIKKLVKENLIDGKIGFELIQIYGSKEKYLDAVEQSAANPEYTRKLLEELKAIYYEFRDASRVEGEAVTEHLVQRLEENTKELYRTENVRAILLKIAEDYLAESKAAQVIDSVYGGSISGIIGKAIFAYYGESFK